MPRRTHFLIVASIFIFYLNGLGQLSPGELSRAHTHLEGLSNCTKCHLLGQKVSSQKCLDCHTEIKQRRDLGKGYHSSVAVKSKECFSCHSDHHGINFQLIRFEKEKFIHDQTGFKLNGAHLKKSCADCHKPANISDLKLKKRKNTYLGLDTRCKSCHADYHQATLRENCQDCHSEEAFKPASRFDHQKAEFQLRGKHQEVACVSCHKILEKNGKKFQEFRGLKFANCTACHTDQHQGKFGQNCKDCHSEQSFSLVKGTEGFDHSKTRFQLEGKHQKVNCRSCHKHKLTDPLKFSHCSDCHNDYHEQQFSVSGKSPDCAECHQVSGFSGASYSIDQHNKTPFQLKGAHLATPCFACHKKTEKWHFRNIGKQCADCHKDIHAPAISSRYYPDSDCRACHDETRWSLVRFDHAQTNFSLTGTHSSQSCRNCHFRKDKEGRSFQQFAGLPVSCYSCHTDIHQAQFVQAGTTDCARCHTTEKFQPASKFDHGSTAFPLDGRHKQVACAKCHQTIKKQSVSYVLYKTGKTKCEDCHQ
jgi:hypothetical protein